MCDFTTLFLQFTSVFCKHLIFIINVAFLELPAFLGPLVTLDYAFPGRSKSTRVPRDYAHHQPSALSCRRSPFQPKHTQLGQIVADPHSAVGTCFLIVQLLLQHRK